MNKLLTNYINKHEQSISDIKKAKGEAIKSAKAKSKIEVSSAKTEKGKVSAKRRLEEKISKIETKAKSKIETEKISIKTKKVTEAIKTIKKSKEKVTYKAISEKSGVSAYQIKKSESLLEKVETNLSTSGVTLKSGEKISAKEIAHRNAIIKAYNQKRKLEVASQPKSISEFLPKSSMPASKFRSKESFTKNTKKYEELLKSKSITEEIKSKNYQHFEDVFKKSKYGEVLGPETDEFLGKLKGLSVEKAYDFMKKEIKNLRGYYEDANPDSDSFDIEKLKSNIKDLSDLIDKL